MRSPVALALLAACAAPVVDDGAVAPSGLADTEVEAVVLDEPVDTEPVDTELADPCLAGGPALRAGTGALAYEPIEPGATLPIVHGLQAGGGWHVWTSFELDHVPQFVELEWLLRVRDTGTVLAHATPYGDAPDPTPPFRSRVALVPRDEGPWACLGTFWGEKSYLDVAAVGATVEAWQPLCGLEVTLEAAVRLPGAAGAPGEVLATASIDFRLSQPDPDYGTPCE